MTRPPAGHTVLSRPTFENFAHANRCTVFLPGVEGGWATARIGSARFACWVEPVALAPVPEAAS